MSLGIAMVIEADLGSAPWDVLHIGLTEKVGLSVGSWTVILGFLLLLIAAIIQKELPKLGAWLNMLFVGVFVDIFLFILDTPTTLFFQMVMLIIGIVVMGFGIGVYISPRCGAGPRDSVMLAVTEKTNLSVATVRAIMEISVLIIGWLLGGPVFIGTVIYSVTIGHISGAAIKWCENRLYRRIERGVKVENIH